MSEAASGVLEQRSSKPLWRLVAPVHGLFAGQFWKNLCGLFDMEGHRPQVYCRHYVRWLSMSLKFQGEGQRDLVTTLEQKNQRLEECLVKERRERAVARETTEALRQSEELHRLIFENVRDFAIFFADVKGLIVRWNPGAERFFGYTEPEILGQPMDVLYTAEDREKGIAEQERISAASTGHSSDERWHLRKDGSRFFVFGMVNALRDDAGKLLGFVKIARDVTERKHFEDRLKQSEELHRLIIENIHDFAIFTCAFDGRIETWNPGAQAIFGYREEEILGRNIAVLYTPEDQASGVPEQERVESIRNAGSATERWYVRQDGRRIFLTGAVRPIRDETGNLRGFAKVTRDITSRKELEDQLQQAREHLEATVSQRTAQLNEKVSELEAFSYSLSHDMRAPVRAIHSFCELALAELKGKIGPPADEYLEKARAAAARLDRLIQDVLALSHLSRPELKLDAIDTEQLVTEIIQERGELQEPNARISVHRPLQPMIGNEASMSQCISNLLENAVKFVSRGVKPTVEIWTEQKDGQVRLWVADNGIGMEGGAQERLFQMFSRIHNGNDYAGTGIGLAIVRKAVARMGGKVGVESVPGNGSRFWLQLPKPEEKSL